MQGISPAGGAIVAALASGWRPAMLHLVRVTTAHNDCLPLMMRQKVQAIVYTWRRQIDCEIPVLLGLDCNS